jgi:photosystem II stability/assembly factor-like uncharacterized protein
LESQFSGVKNNLQGIDFLDSLNGLVVGYGGIILKTKDGGENWEVEK